MCYNDITSFSLLVTLTAWAPGVEFTPGGLALWCLMLKASLGLSWSFFKAPATDMLRSACSGMWHHVMRSVPTFGTAVLRGKAHTMKMENLDAGPEGMKPHPCVMEMHWAGEVLKSKCSSFEWITRNIVWQRASRADFAKHILTLPQVALQKSKDLWLKRLLFFFFSVMQMGLLFHEFIQSLLDVNFQHPQHPLGKSYMLCLWKKKIILLDLPMANLIFHHFCIRIDGE